MRRSAGTRTFLDVIRSGFRGPTPESIAADHAALERGDELVVSCFLSGPTPPYPGRPKQGQLELWKGQVRWRASGCRPSSIPIDADMRLLDVRDVARTDANVKRGGKVFGILPIPEFKVVVAETDRGVLEFFVPSPDVPLVASALEGGRARASGR